MKVVIIDYGMGNIQSLISVLRYLGIQKIDVSNQYETLKYADKLILPGVGSFAKAMKNIQDNNLDHYLYEMVIQNKKPILGICLGMQLMSKSSTENGETLGLGFIDGTVTKIDDNTIKVPHVGFNQVKVNANFKLYQYMDGHLDFYFTHSYKLDSTSNINQCICHYGKNFIASYELENIAGVQFHPELSQTNGLKLIKNFIKNF